MAARSLLIFVTFATIVGDPLRPIFSSLKLISSILKTLISVFLAFTVPLSEGLLGEIPVGVKESAHGSGNLII